MTEVTAALIAAFVAIIITWLKPLIEDAFSNKKTEREAKHEAARLIIALDRFIHRAAAVAYDEGSPDPYVDEHYGEYVISPNSSEPEFMTFEPPISWKLLGPHLMYDFFQLEDMQSETKARMSGAAEYEDFGPDHSGWFRERRNGYADIAEKALAVRDSLQSSFGLPARRIRGWDAVADMREKHKAKSE